MIDRTGTKEQLINELMELRQRVGELEASENGRKRSEVELRKSEKAARRLAKENAIIAEIGRIISSTLNIEEVYKALSQKVREIIPFDRITINLVNSEQSAHTVPYVEGAYVSGRQPGDLVSLSGTTVEKTVRTRKGIVLRMEDEEVAAEFPGLLPDFQAGMRSGLTVPLISGDRVIGGLALRSIDPGIYTEHDLRLAENVSNQIAGAIVNAQLYAERKEMEKTLLKSEERFRNLFELSKDSIFIIDQQTGRFVGSNRAANQLYGYSGEEFMRMNVVDISAEPEKTEDAIRRHVTEIPLRFHRKRDGTVFPVEITGNYFMEGGRILHTAHIRDITERKQAEESLKQSEENARQLAQENAIMAEIGRIISSDLNIDEIYESFSREVKKVIPFDRIVIDIIDTEKRTVKNVYMAGGKIRDRNVEEIYPLEGSGNAEMVRTKSTLLIQTEDFDEYKDRFPMLLSTFQAGFRSMMNVPLFSQGKIIGGLLLRSRIPYVYTDKDVRIAERIGFQIAGAIANAQLYVERLQSEKERIVLEEQLHQAQKMEAIGTLAGGIAHDFNNILSAILGYGDLASFDIKENSRAKHNLEQLMKAAHRAKDLVQQILTFSRQGRQERKPLDIRPIIKEGLRFLRASLPATIEMHQQIEEELGRVEADPTEVHQVLMNLCTNAAHAMDEKGGVLEVLLDEVEVEEGSFAASQGIGPGLYVRLRVSDTGHGMAPEILKRIFDPYFTTKGVGKGTGLGLAVVHGIVKNYGGGITVSSDMGKGSTFDIYFPKIDTMNLSSEADTVEPFPLGSHERVLFVDDEKAIAEVGREVLEHLRYEVVTRTSSVEALELFRQQGDQFDLVITDMTMPNMRGDKLAQELLKIRPGIPIILCTGFSEHITEEKAKAIGIREFAMKPLVMKDLAKAIRRALESEKP